MKPTLTQPSPPTVYKMKNNLTLAGLTLAVLLTGGCNNPSQNSQTGTSMGITKSDFGKADDQAVDLYTLTNANGAVVKISSYGGIVTDIQVPDKTGKLGSVILGFDSLDKYLAGHPYFGCITGRYANRIAAGKFSIDGNDYELTAKNNGDNHLHGGEKGFDKHIWSAEEIKGDASVSYTHLRAHETGA